MELHRPRSYEYSRSLSSCKIARQAPQRRRPRMDRTRVARRLPDPRLCAGRDSSRVDELLPYASILAATAVTHAVRNPPSRPHLVSAKTLAARLAVLLAVLTVALRVTASLEPLAFDQELPVPEDWS